MRVLITQPAQEAAISARALAARGHEPIIIPLVTVERESAPAINLASAQGFLATSPEGVRALADHVGVRTFPIFVDSDLTAAEARRLGFKDVQAAKDDSQDLARLVERALKPANGALVYACNTAAPVNLGAMLGNMGFAVRPLPLYSIKRVAEIPQELRAKLESKGIDVALFMSPDEARAFVTLIQRDETAPPITGLKTVTATPAIAAPLRALKGASVTVASASDPDSVWATLDGELIDKVEEERRERERKIKEEEARRRAEEERLQEEKEERERIAREKAAAEHIERERLEVERQRIAKEEAERVELERLAREEERRVRAEDERRRKEEAERVRAEKLAREKAEKEERDRLRAEEKARAKAERERLAAEKAAQEQAGRARLAAERAERERLKAEEAARAKAEKEERDRLRAEEETRAKAERERLAAEKAAQEQAGRARLAAERAERERLKAEEAARAKAEKDRLAAERAAREDAERERLRAEEEARQRLEKERLAAERAEQERLRKEREDRERAERAEQERLRKEQEARERAERDRIAAEQAAHEKAEREQRAREKAARDEAERQRLAAERAAWEEAERVQRAAEKAERERLDAERHERERIAREAREKERAEKERLAREEAERVRAEKVRIAAEREKERLEKERGAREEAERARAEAARLAAAREEERLERMRTAREEADRARAEKERLANARAEADRIARQKREEEERIEREKRAETARLENERLAREKTERERLKAEQAAQEAERKRTLKEEAAAKKARDEQARREEAAAAHAAQERLAQELAERRRAEKEEAGRAQAERKRLANEQKAQAKAEKARMAAERKPSGGWFSGLFGKPAAPADPAPDPRWNMVVSHDPPSAPSPTDPPAAIASAAPSWNDTPMTDPVRETKDNPPVPVPSALQELDELVARESHGKESGAESLADAKPAARSGGGRSAQMQAEDAADERMRDRLASWGRGEPETPQPHDGEQADPVPEAAVAPPPVRRRGAGRSIALFFVLATIATAAMMTSHRWLPLLVKEPPAPVASAPAPNAPAPTPPQVKPAPPAVAPAPNAPVAPAAQPAAPSLGDTSNQTIAALMARVATLEAALGNTVRLDEINRRVETLAGRSADANSVLALADRVTALEQAGRSAADQRAIAVALTIAATQWRDAVVTGRPFLKEWDTVKALSGQSQTDTVFAKYAGTGLPTLAEMQRRLDVAAAAAVRASYLPNDTASWLRRTLDRVFSVISVRRTDVDTGDGVDAIFVRAERAAEGGNLAAAVAEMKKLTGAPLAAVTPWIELAEARVAAEEAAQESVIAGATTLAQPSATPAAAASAAKAE